MIVKMDIFNYDAMMGRMDIFNYDVMMGRMDNIFLALLFDN